MQIGMSISAQIKQGAGSQHPHPYQQTGVAAILLASSPIRHPVTPLIQAHPGYAIHQSIRHGQEYPGHAANKDWRAIPLMHSDIQIRSGSPWPVSHHHGLKMQPAGHATTLHPSRKISRHHPTHGSWQTRALFGQNQHLAISGRRPYSRPVQPAANQVNTRDRK